MVGDVKIAGSQPWPIGRGGSCELMIGAVASATSTAMAINETEVRSRAYNTVNILFISALCLAACQCVAPWSTEAVMLVYSAQR